MLDSFFGLPLHPLVVHATVVLVPLAAILLIASAASARVRRWAGVLPVVFAVLAAILVPVTTSSGEALAHRVGEGGLVEAHAEMGEQLLPFSIAVAVLAAALWWLTRAERVGDGVKGTTKTLVMVIVALSVIAGLGSIVQVARIGHSGAEAAWTDVMQTTTPGGGEGSDGGDGD